MANFFEETIQISQNLLRDWVTAKPTSRADEDLSLLQSIDRATGELDTWMATSRKMRQKKRRGDRLTSVEQTRVANLPTLEDLRELLVEWRERMSEEENAHTAQRLELQGRQFLHDIQSHGIEVRWPKLR